MCVNDSKAYFLQWVKENSCCDLGTRGSSTESEILKVHIFRKKDLKEKNFSLMRGENRVI